MKLQYRYSVKKRIITIDLTTVDFTADENKALDMMGEPIVEFQKTYPGDFTISLRKKIRSQFKCRIKIDGTMDVEAANEAGQQFLEDIQEKLQEVMDALMESYEGQIFPAVAGELPVSNYGGPEPPRINPNLPPPPFRRW